MKSIVFVAISAFMLSSCSETITIEDRPGATIAQSRTDHVACHAEVKRQPDLYVPPQPTLAGAAGAGVIAGVSSVMQEERLVAVCMEKKGYSQRMLTAEETRLVRSAPRGDARDALFDAVLKTNDAGASSN